MKECHFQFISIMYCHRTNKHRDLTSLFKPEHCFVCIIQIISKFSHPVFLYLFSLLSMMWHNSTEYDSFFVWTYVHYQHFGKLSFWIIFFFHIKLTFSNLACHQHHHFTINSSIFFKLFFIWIFVCFHFTFVLILICYSSCHKLTAEIWSTFFMTWFKIYFTMISYFANGRIQTLLHYCKLQLTTNKI